MAKLTARQKALNNLRARARRLETKGFIFDYESLSSLTTSQANRLRRSLLERAAVGYRLPSSSIFGAGEIVPIEEYNRYKEAARSYEYANRRIDPFYRQPRILTQSREGLRRYTEGLEKRTGRENILARNKQMIDNYITALPHLSRPVLEQAIYDKILKMGDLWAVQKLVDAEKGNVQGIWQTEVFYNIDAQTVDIEAYIRWWGIDEETADRIREEANGVWIDEMYL